MSLDLDFNKSLTKEEIEEKTSLKVEIHNGGEFLTDEYGNTVFFKGYGITLYGPRNITKIMDELVRAFDLMFIDDDAIDKLDYEPENYDASVLFWETMNKYGYVKDGKLTVPERDTSEYQRLNITNEEIDDALSKEEDDLPF
jgi:hypothetical protein